MRALFWGTPEFATPSLRALIGEGFDVVGVVTQPDRPHGRSRSRLVAPPVKQVASAEQIPILQPDRPRGDEFVERLRTLEPDISVVVAYGHILRAEVIDLPRLGTVNAHASLLPALRGAAPIQAAIREGLAETGVTIMQMVPALDAGPIILQMKTPIADDETFGELSLRLSELSALALVEALTLLSLGAATQQPQDETHATYAPKLDREHTRISWQQSVTRVARIIRAFDPVPGAVTTHRGTELKLFGASVAAEVAGAPGRVIDIGQGIVVACGDGSVRITDVQPAGRRRMGAVDWARGRGIGAGDTLGT